MLIQQRMHGTRVAEDGQVPPDGAAAVELAAGLDFILSLSAAVKDNTRALRAAAAPVRWEDCHPVPLAPVASPNGVAGTINDERWEPREGFAWHIVAVSVVFGAGTTLATVYRDAVGAQNQRNSQATGFLWEPKAEILLPNSRLVFTSVGGPITVSGDAIEISLDFLPTYLA